MQPSPRPVDIKPGGEPLCVVVAGPEREVTPADLRRLFRGDRLTPARRERLARQARVLVTCGTTVVGLAAYERVASELRVHEFAIDRDMPCDSLAVAESLLHAIELAGIAGGNRRIVITPRALAHAAALRESGYAGHDEGCAGRWLQKNLF